jgi:hypothetical protein
MILEQPASGGTGKLLQVAQQTFATVYTTTASIPADNTIPQSDEGDEMWTANFTPVSATSKLYVRLVLPVGGSAALGVIVALFLNVETDCRIATITSVYAGGGSNILVLETVIDSPGTSQQTFKVRWGTTSGTARANSANGTTNTFGGKYFTTFTVEEVAS